MSLDSSCLFLLEYTEYSCIVYGIQKGSKLNNNKQKRLKKEYSCYASNMVFFTSDSVENSTLVDGLATVSRNRPTPKSQSRRCSGKNAGTSVTNTLIRFHGAEDIHARQFLFIFSDLFFYNTPSSS